MSASLRPDSSTSPRYNVARGLAEIAAREPDRPGIVFSAARGVGEQTLSFAALNRLTDRHAHQLGARGIAHGARTLVMIRPGPDLIAVVFALLKLGAVPVLIDPGMGLRGFLKCVADCAPVALVGIARAHLLRRLFRGTFRTVRIAVKLDANPGDQPAPASFPITDTRESEEAAIAFTSGSTGTPKGVVYRHRQFRAQVNAMREEMGIQPGDVHLVAVYIFALFNPTLGVTTLVPDIDPARPGALNPADLVDLATRHRATFSLGSPTLWRLVSDHCDAHRITIPTLAKVFMFGAPVYPELARRTAAMLTGGSVFTPYGATEALPLTLIDHAEIGTLADPVAGRGTCVGRPIHGVEIRVIEIHDAPIRDWADAKVLPPSEVGEVVVRGDVVTDAYVNRPRETELAKIASPVGPWHRMGDLGYLDEKGRLWFCGRMSHRVVTRDETMLPIHCEAVFNRHPAVARTALVGVGPRGRQRPVLVVETRSRRRFNRRAARAKLLDELRSLAAVHSHTRRIESILFHAGFPMDVRHEAKIRREVLAAWASRRVA